ncbi:unnamed protein product [Gadus morhua 'NCC']
MDLVRTVDKVPGRGTVQHALELKALRRTGRPTTTENPQGLRHMELQKLTPITITIIEMDEVRGNGSAPVCFLRQLSRLCFHGVNSGGREQGVRNMGIVVYTVEYFLVLQTP